MGSARPPGLGQLSPAGGHPGFRRHGAS
jgi:hypothetical protein